MSKKIISERYTYASLVDEAMNRTKHENCTDNDSRTGGKNFTQTENIEQARDFAVNGWDLGLEQYKIEDGVMSSGTTELLPSLAGCLPHIQNTIMGFPEQMYATFDSREYNLPTLDIVVNLVYSCGIDSNDTLRFGKSMVAFINKKAATRNIRLTGVFASIQGDKKVYQYITLKDFDSALVINNIAFAFHPSFFRRLWFGVLEGKSYWVPGYGRPLFDYKEEVLKTLSKSDETIVFRALNNVDSFEFTEDTLQSVT